MMNNQSAGRAMRGLSPCLFLLLAGLATPGADAVTLTFDEVIAGAVVFEFDADGDASPDAIFSTMDEFGFNTFGPGANQSFIVEPGLEGTTLLSPDLRVDFPNGAESALGFAFAMSAFEETPDLTVTFRVFDGEGRLIASRTGLAAFTQPEPPLASNFPEGLVDVSFAGVAAYATLDFDATDAARYIIDNFIGTFGSSEILPPIFSSIPATPGAGDELGAAIAADGNLVAVGQPNAAGGGRVIVYRVEGGVLVEDQTIPVPAGFFAQAFGGALALQGDRLLIGAPRTDPTRRKEGFAALQAAIYERTQAGWQLKQPLAPPVPAPGTGYGSSVALDGGLMAVGAPDDAGGGAVYAYEIDFAANQLVGPPTTLVRPGGQAGDQFGKALATSNGTLAVGAPGAPIGGTVAGLVQLYEQVSANLTDLSPAGAVTGSGATQNGGFGTSVALGGANLVVGAPGESSGAIAAGAAYVFTGSGATFAEQRRLESPAAEGGAAFGSSVAASGDRVVVGAPGAGAEGRAFRFDEGSAPETLAPAGPGVAGFGTSVATTGTVVAIGAPLSQASSGAAFTEIDARVLFASDFEQ